MTTVNAFWAGFGTAAVFAILFLLAALYTIGNRPKW